MAQPTPVQELRDPDDDRCLRLLRPSARPHRVLHARRGRAPRPAGAAGRGAGDAGGRDDRPRQRLRRLRVLQGRQGGGGQADHRHGGVRRPQHQPLRAQGRQLLRRRLRRRLEPRRLHPHDPALGVHRGHAQPLPAEHRRLARRVLQAPPRRPRAAGPARQGHHRDHRLPVRRGAGAPALRQLRRGPPGRGRPPGHLRSRQLLHGADGPRPPPGEPRPRRPAPAGQGPADPAARDQRLPLRRPEGRALPGAPALHQLRLDHGHPGRRRPGPALRLLRHRLLHQDRRRDAVAVGRQARAAGGVRQHPAHRRALRRQLHRGQRHLHAAVPLPARRGRDVVDGQGGRARAACPLPRRHLRRGPPARRVRARRDHPDGLQRLLPRRRRLHQLGQGQRHPRRARPRLRRRLDRRLRPADHRPRPAGPRPAVRAVPQPRPRLDARLRHRLRRASSRRGHQVRLRQVRRGPRLDDRHLRDDQVQAGDQGLLADPRLPVRDGRPGHQGDAAGGDGQGRPAQGPLQQRAPALQRGRRVPVAGRVRPRRTPRGRHRDRHRGPQAPVGRARRRRDHVQRAAHRHHPDAPAAGRRRDDHPVRLPHVRVAGPDQDGLPGAAQPHGPRRLPQEHRGQPRRDRGPRGPPARRPGDVRPAPEGRDPRRLPARRRPDAGPAALDAARRVQGHLRGRRSLPPRPDGHGLPQQVRPPQDRPRARRRRSTPSSPSRWPRSSTRPTASWSTRSR